MNRYNINLVFAGFTLLFIFIFGKVAAQKKIIFNREERISSKGTSENLLGTINSNVHNRTARIYKSNTNEMGVLFDNGTRASLLKNENVESFSGNNLATVRRDFASHITYVAKYELGDNTLRKLNTIKIEHGEANVSFTKNSDYTFISDDIEGPGSFLEIYDKTLKPVISYKPFETGFSNVSFESQENNVLIVASQGNGNFKFTSIDGKTGHINREKLFSLNNFELSKAYIFKKHVILYGTNIANEREIICYNYSFNLLWRKKDNIPHYHRGIGFLSNEDESKMFYTTASLSNSQVYFKIVCIESSTGRELWNHNTLDIYGNTSIEIVPDKESNGVYITAFEYSISRKSVLATAGYLHSNRSNGSIVEYSNNKLLILSDQGVLQQHDVQSKDKCEILMSDNEIKVVASDKIYVYE